MDSVPSKRPKQLYVPRPDVEMQCFRCKAKYPATSEWFVKNVFKKFGLEYCCHQCNRKKQQEYRASNPEKVKDQKAADYHKHKDAYLRRATEYHQNNPEVNRLAKKRYSENHPERVKIAARVAQSKRRSLKRTNAGSHTRADVELLIKTQNEKCWWCGCKLSDKYHVDHRVALSRGGSNSANNLCITCERCNLSKGKKLPHEWSNRLL